MISFSNAIGITFAVLSVPGINRSGIILKDLNTVVWEA